MERLHLTQGSDAWHAHRATARNASEAAAMLGLSPYMTRTELLTAMKTGIRREPSHIEAERFAKGHRVEAALRPLAEKIVGEALYPLVGTDGYLSASFDGLTMADDLSFEAKQLNDDLRAIFARGDVSTEDGALGLLLPIYHQVQMEQGLAISGAEKTLFSCGDIDADGNVTEVHHCWYLPNPALRERIKKGWAQFDADLVTFEPQAATEKVTAAPIESLPAISARIEGSLSIHSNLDAFGQALRGFVAKIPARPTSDQEFADCDAACKALKKAEDALDAAEANALGQVQTVEALTRTIADLRNVARTARLSSEKMVKARKEQIRIEEVQRGQKAFSDFVAGLNTTIGKPYMPPITVDFAGAISGKKTLDSLRAAVDQHLADKKIEANAVCARIVTNLRVLRERADGYQGLFPDTAQLVLKAEDDCTAVIESRIATHKAEEQRRAEAAAEKERDRIRAEEQAKAEKDARDRMATEAAARPAATSAPVQAPTAPAANAPTANVIDMPRTGKPTLKITDIQQRLNGLPVTGVYIETTLGIAPAKRENKALYWLDTDWERICQALMFLVDRARTEHKLAA